MSATNKPGRMPSAERDQKKSHAKQLYIQGFSLTGIAEITSVSPKTLTGWRNAESWEKERELHTIRPSEIKRMLLEYVQALKEGKPPKYKADDLSKIAAAFDRLEDNRKRAVYTMESFDAFCSFVLTKAGKLPQKKRAELLSLLQNVRPVLDEYVTSLLRYDENGI